MNNRCKPLLALIVFVVGCATLSEPTQLRHVKLPEAKPLPPVEGLFEPTHIGPEGLARIFYFETNSERLDSASQNQVEAHGAYLLDNPAVIVQIEGHTDRRGTSEYNIALGERRALTVQDIFRRLGVPSVQLIVVSYGELLPVVEGSDGQTLAKNRRVEILY